MIKTGYFSDFVDRNSIIFKGTYAKKISDNNKNKLKQSFNDSKIPLK